MSDVEILDSKNTSHSRIPIYFEAAIFPYKHSD